MMKLNIQAYDTLDTLTRGEWTIQQLAEELGHPVNGCRVRVARLRHLGLAEPVGKRRNPTVWTASARGYRAREYAEARGAMAGVTDAPLPMSAGEARITQDMVVECLALHDDGAASFTALSERLAVVRRRLYPKLSQLTQQGLVTGPDRMGGEYTLTDAGWDRWRELLYRAAAK